MLKSDLKNSRVVSVKSRHHSKSVDYTCTSLIQTQNVRVETSSYSELALKFLELLRKVQLVIRAGEVVKHAVKFSSLRGTLCCQWEYLADLEALI
jgi:hypothetical protein